MRGFKAFGGAEQSTCPNPTICSVWARGSTKARRHEAAKAPSHAAPTPLGIAFRFATELVAALVVGGALGWGIDWLFGTRPVFIVVMFVLGAAAGIRNVMRAAKELNARAAAAAMPPPRTTTARIDPVAMNPMEQFAVKPLVPLHLPAALGGYDVSFTNQALWMCIVVAAASLFLTLAVGQAAGWCPPARSRWPNCPTNSSQNMIQSAAGQRRACASSPSCSRSSSSCCSATFSG